MVCHTFQGMSHFQGYVTLLRVCHTFIDLSHFQRVCHIFKGMSHFYRFVAHFTMSQLQRYIFKLMSHFRGYVKRMSNFQVTYQKVCVTTDTIVDDEVFGLHYFVRQSWVVVFWGFLVLHWRCFLNTCPITSFNICSALLLSVYLSRKEW